MKIKLDHKKTARIEMLPLIDIVFLLLVVFIYSMLSMSVHTGMPVKLPESETARPDTKTELSVTVKNQNEIYLNQDRVSIETLSEQLKKIAGDSGSEGVLLFAKEDLPYQVLYTVLDKIKLAGHTKISLQARLKQDQERQ